jgi:hypothetical protein
MPSATVAWRRADQRSVGAGRGRDRHRSASGRKHADRQGPIRAEAVRARHATSSDLGAPPLVGCISADGRVWPTDFLGSPTAARDQPMADYVHRQEEPAQWPSLFHGQYAILQRGPKVAALGGPKSMFWARWGATSRAWARAKDSRRRARRWLTPSSRHRAGMNPRRTHS